MCGEKRRSQHGRLQWQRITPACAGKSASEAKPCRSESGSPPHVRGKVSPLIFGRQGIGITPACAGKSVVDIQVVNGRLDHPRMCGEKRFQPDNMPLM